MLNHPVLGLFLGTMTPSGENTRFVLRQNSSSSKSKLTTSTGDAKLMSDKTISQGKKKNSLCNISSSIQHHEILTTIC